jgi:DNA topoisomerase-2
MTEYKKLSHREHILELPDTYVGSVATQEESRWILDESGKMAYKKIQFNPGFYKLFDELLVNARDARIRSISTPNPIKNIHVSMKTVEGVLEITVENDGDGIPIQKHAEHDVWIPELIFGHLLTSGNYDKEEEKIVGGKNGSGAKLVNVFSHEFKVEVRSPAQGQKYSQVWKDHMLVCGKPSIRAVKLGDTIAVRDAKIVVKAIKKGVHINNMPLNSSDVSVALSLEVLSKAKTQLCSYECLLDWNMLLQMGPKKIVLQFKTI